MVDGYYKQLVAILRREGFVRVKGGKGSHEKWRRPNDGSVNVPRSSRSRITANAVLKQAGLPDRL